MVIVISSPTPVANEAAIVNCLLSEGVEIYHIRKKDFTENEMREYMKNIDEKYFSKLVLHSHYHLAKEYNLKGIHISKTPIPSEQYKHISISCHSLTEINNCNKNIEYRFLSPIFNSISKEGYNSSFNLAELKDALKNRKDKIIALGGINENNIASIKEINFAGIALLGAIWGNKNPVNAFKRIKEKWEKKELVY